MLFKSRIVAKRCIIRITLDEHGKPVITIQG